MGEQLFKQVDIMLNGTKSVQGKALKIIARSIDEKFDQADQQAEERHKSILDAIDSMKEDNMRFQEDTRTKFKTLEVVSFLSTHRQILLLVAFALLFLAGAGAQDIILKILK